MVACWSHIRLVLGSIPGAHNFLFSLPFTIHIVEISCNIFQKPNQHCYIKNKQYPKIPQNFTLLKFHVTFVKTKFSSVTLKINNALHSENLNYFENQNSTLQKLHVIFSKTKLSARSTNASQFYFLQCRSVMLSGALLQVWSSSNDRL